MTGEMQEKTDVHKLEKERDLCIRLMGIIINRK